MNEDKQREGINSLRFKKNILSYSALNLFWDAKNPQNTRNYDTFQIMNPPILKIVKSAISQFNFTVKFKE